MPEKTYTKTEVNEIILTIVDALINNERLDHDFADEHMSDTVGAWLDCIIDIPTDKSQIASAERKLDRYHEVFGEILSEWNWNYYYNILKIATMHAWDEFICPYCEEEKMVEIDNKEGYNRHERTFFCPRCHGKLDLDSWDKIDEWVRLKELYSNEIWWVEENYLMTKDEISTEWYDKQS